ncbi:hypothetical protein K9N50_04230 [bacterium]|nr:hypothetical protein [bacterium]
MNKNFKIAVSTFSVLLFVMFLSCQSLLAQDTVPVVEDPKAVTEDLMIEQNEESLNTEEVGADSTDNETTVDDLPPSADDVLMNAEEADANWRMWMQLDDYGERAYWFRRSFEIVDPPASGKLYITCDDNYSLYVNGFYIAADETDEIDWMDVHEHNIGEWLKLGKNTVAVEAIDVNSTRQGLVVAVEYSTVPDIDTQLDRMMERELDKQNIARDEQIKREAARTALRESQLQPPTEQELKDMRSQEKNKLD